MSCIHSDFLVVLNDELNSDSDKSGGLGICVGSKWYYPFVVIHRHKKMVENLFSAYLYHWFYHFTILTYNKQTNIGAVLLKKWIVGYAWQI